jgi:hypothetical protein
MGNASGGSASETANDGHGAGGGARTGSTGANSTK